MCAARPTTWSPHAGLQFGNPYFNPTLSCFLFFRILDPADPFIAHEWRDVFP